MYSKLKTPIWQPSSERVRHSNMTAFMRYVENLTKIPVKNYDDIYNWSLNNTEEFWKSIWVIGGMIHSKSFDKILSSRNMLEAKWFEGAKLNFAENLLRYRDNQTAIISAREESPTFKITYAELYNNVSSLAFGLKKLGVKKGDRVAGFVTDIPEAIIAMLATTSIGAVWSSCSPDFGLKGVLDRFGQIQPKILFAIESYKYNGKLIDCKSKIKQITENIPDIENIVLIPQFNDFTKMKKQDEIFLDKGTKWLNINDLLSLPAGEIEFEQVPFDHPVYIMYSSGTTGVPKCIVHGVGGTLLQHYKELSLHTNLKRNDVITYYTTCGWMMWNWLVSSLMIGSTVFLYDGSPAYPGINVLWQNIEEEKVSVFGTSPKFIGICQKSGLVPKKQYDLSNLKTILSTGSPLTQENFRWVYENVKEDLQLSSISGGTDIISCFMLGNPNLPVYPGEIQCRGLGMKVEAYNENGEPVIEQKGELVCTAPFPSRPVYFWNDPDMKKYKAAYYNYYPDVWRHGDYITITENGGIIVYGRSDATLNPGGVRIGTGEIYRIVEGMDEVIDSIAVAQNWNNDQRIVLFVVLKEKLKLDKVLIEKIKNNIKASATPRHMPHKIIQISEVPRTISGKKVELAVTKVIHGERVENKDALLNPHTLDQFLKIPELNS